MADSEETGSGAMPEVAGFEVVEMVPVDARLARVYEHGWQSWSPASTYPLDGTSYRPHHPESATMCYRPGRLPPARGFQGEGLLAVDPGDGGPVRVQLRPDHRAGRVGAVHHPPAVVDRPTADSVPGRAGAGPQPSQPEPTKIVTSDPGGALAPPTGAWATTRPLVRGGAYATGIALTWKLALRSTAVAVACLSPTTFGTRTSTGSGAGGGAGRVRVGGRVRGRWVAGVAGTRVLAGAGLAGMRGDAGALTVGHRETVVTAASAVDG
jgi:hypothetical protein